MWDKQKVAEQIKEIEGMGFGDFSPPGFEKKGSGWTRRGNHVFYSEYGEFEQGWNVEELAKLTKEETKDPLDEWIEEWIRKNGG